MVNIALDTNMLIWCSNNDFIFIENIIRNDKHRIVLYPVNIFELLVDLKKSITLKYYYYFKKRKKDVPIDIIKQLIQESPGLKESSTLKYFEYFKNRGIKVCCHSWYEYFDIYLNGQKADDYNFYNYNQEIIDKCPYYDDLKTLEKRINKDTNQLKQIGCMLLVYRLHLQYVKLICEAYINKSNDCLDKAEQYFQEKIKKSLSSIKKLSGAKLDNRIKNLANRSINIDKNEEYIGVIKSICRKNGNIITVIKSVAKKWFPELSNFELKNGLEAKYILLPLMYMIKIVLESIMESDEKGEKLYGPKQLKKGCIQDPEFLYYFLITDTKYFFTFDKVFYEIANWILDNLNQIYGDSDKTKKILVKTDMTILYFLDLMEGREKNQSNLNF